MPSTSYADLYGNCLANKTLPSLAFRMKSCSIKWKHVPHDQFLKGAKSGPNAVVVNKDGTQFPYQEMIKPAVFAFCKTLSFCFKNSSK